jgi:Na+/H+ antiporter NhaD/arsenite permease-like protein
MFAIMNNTDQFMYSVIKLSSQFAFLYVAGIIFFFYLRSRRMRNIYKDIKNYSKHRLIDRKIKFKGVLVLMVLVYWFIVVSQPIKFSDSTTNFALVCNMTVSAMIYFVIFVLGSQTGLWLSDDEDFSNPN